MFSKRDPKFYSELKQLNEDLIKLLKETQDKSPHFDFTDTLQDYIKQFKELESQYPVGGVPNFFAKLINQEQTQTQINQDDADDDDAPPEVPEPNVDKYEEPNAKYSVRCKLYSRGNVVDGTSSISLEGFGILYVKDLETPNKLQVIFRQDPDLRKVLLNQVITQNIPIKQLPKAVQMILPGQAGDTKLYIAKVKEEKDAMALYQVLTSIKS